jgi:hypothetical protein
MRYFLTGLEIPAKKKSLKTPGMSFVSWNNSDRNLHIVKEDAKRRID